ncbi:MAG: YigZ family protein [Clostridia bacterium]|nr:YigZ family protein [Clostridia bacterium]
MGKNYRTIKEWARAEHVEKKSRFIATAKPVQTEEEALSFIAEIKKEFSDARHNCYAYVLRDNNIARFSDDGEPGGTAGMPMMEVLKQEELTDVAVVVTRYFGGILLGAGGLVRAYSKGAKIGVDAGKISVMTYCGKVQITASYDLYGKVRYLLEQAGFTDLEAEFSQDVTVSLYVPEPDLETLSQKVTEETNGKASFSVLFMEHRLIEV